MQNKNKAVVARQSQVDEAVKCGMDPIYFITKYLYIQHPNKGRLPFHLYDYQKDVINILQNKEVRKLIVLKSRQLGLSTVTAAYCLWLAMFEPDTNILIMATKLKVGTNMIAKLRLAYKMLPKWLLQLFKLEELEGDSVRYVKFANGSKIEAIPTSIDAGRSESVSLFVIDEAAHIENFDELWGGIKPTLSTGGKCIMFSSPNGQKGLFYDIWKSTEDEASEWARLELPWTVHPERDEKWFEMESKDMPEWQVAQEFLCSFAGSSETFFKQDQIEKIKNHCESPFSTMGPSGDIWVWRDPLPNHNYALVADVARGDGNDSSAFHILDQNTNEIVAEYKGKIMPDRFGELIFDIGGKYNNAIVVIEKNNIGPYTAGILKNLNYPNLYYETKTEEEAMYLTDEDKLNRIPGFTTSPKNRDLILSSLEETIRNGKISIFSSRLAKEIEMFVWKDGKAKAKGKKNNDDLVMSLAILCYIFKPNGNGYANYNSNQLNEWHKAFLMSIGGQVHSVNISAPINSIVPNNNKISTNNPYIPQKTNPYMQYTNKTVNNIPNGLNRTVVEQELLMREMFGWMMK